MNRSTFTPPPVMNYPTLEGIPSHLPVTISRDGTDLVTVASPDAAFRWLLKNTNQSASYALVWGGYRCRVAGTEPAATA